MVLGLTASRQPCSTTYTCHAGHCDEFGFNNITSMQNAKRKIVSKRIKALFVFCKLWKPLNMIVALAIRNQSTSAVISPSSIITSFCGTSLTRLDLRSPSIYFDLHIASLYFQCNIFGTVRGDMRWHTVTYGDIVFASNCFQLLPVDKTVDLEHRTCWGVISWTSSILSAKSFAKSRRLRIQQRRVWIKSNCWNHLKPLKILSILDSLILTNCNTRDSKAQLAQLLSNVARTVRCLTSSWNGRSKMRSHSEYEFCMISILHRLKQLKMPFWT